MFYLLKGTREREKTGDILIMKNEISSIAGETYIFKDFTAFIVRIDMKNRETRVAKFNTKEEARAVIRELIGSGIGDEMIFDVNDRTEPDIKREALKTLLS